jgi:ubiquinol-cytochrome c reductase cytochrome c subunit
MRRRGRKIAVLVWLAGLAAATLAEAQPQSGIVRPTFEPRQPSVQLGAELYAGNCSTCHGIAGQGIARPRVGAGGVIGAGPPLRGVGALAADFYLRTGYMPLSSIHSEPESAQQGTQVLFSDKEIRSLVAYVASLGPGPAIPHPDPAAGNLSQGQQLFAANCAGCHQIMARGGFATGARIPELQTVSATEIAEAVRTGPYLMPRFSSEQISDRQLDDIIRYVISIRHPDDRGGWGIGNIGPIPEGLVTWWIAAPLLLIACLLLAKRFGS